MPGLCRRDVVVDASHKFAPRRILRDYFSKPDDEAFGDEAFGIVFDLFASDVALDERSVMSFARTLAYGDGKTSLRLAAIVAGAHRSYIACLFAELPQADRAIGVFRTVAQAQAWLADRSGADSPIDSLAAVYGRGCS